MHRIDNFEVDVLWRDVFSRAELLCDRAAPLRRLTARNIRGSQRSWMRVQLWLDGESLGGRRRIENVPTNETADCDLIKSCLPCDLSAGTHRLELRFELAGGETEVLSHTVDVLPDNHICLRFDDADLLAAHVPVNSPTVGRFADEAVGKSDLRDVHTVLNQFYDALLRLKLPYQSTPPLLREDYQIARSPQAVLKCGGNCADLSLFFAGLCYWKALRPALILLSDHMMAGCLTGDAPGSDAKEALAAGALIPVDVVGVSKGLSFSKAMEDARAILADPKRPAILVDVCKCLRSDVRSVPIPDDSSVAPESSCETAQPGSHPSNEAGGAPRCPKCTYSGEMRLTADGAMICPACETVIALAAPSAPPTLTLTAQTARCRIQGGRAVATGASMTAENVHVPGVWQGLPVTAVAERAFDGCAMARIDLPDGLQTIGGYAFRRCANLAETVLPDSLQSLGCGAFSGCAQLREVRVPGGVRTIARMAFHGCAGLRRAVLEEGVETIDARAFAECASLTRVDIPASVKRICAGAFEGCANLSEVRFASDETRVDPTAFARCPLIFGTNPHQ